SSDLSGRPRSGSCLRRAGAPDALDRMVAFSFGAMAVQMLGEGKSGLMMSIREGRYTTVPIDSCIQGKKRVDVKRLYDAEAYRPSIKHVLDMPMFLY
ncbi:MAG: hypothetical protein RLT05_36945, partial [Bauldia litoralis]